MAPKTRHAEAKHVKPNSNQVDPVQPIKERGRKRRRAASESDKDDHSDSEDNYSSDNEETKTIQPAKTSIPRPKGSPFADALSPGVLEFMALLAANNDRDFMRVQQKQWLSTRSDFTDFVGMLINELHTLDPTILVEEPKDAVYRQHRDLRFTNDRRPYKSHLSASFSRGGKKSPFAGYHLSVCPGNKTHVAAGIWQPSSARLSRIRQGIIENGGLMREALDMEAVKNVFGKCGLDVLEDTDKLKTAPKGIAKDHPEIDLLRYKSLVISKSFTDVEVVSEGFLDKLLDAYEAMVPFVAVLNSWD
ncbi:hypothetical protein DFQ28_007496 [Apophysomyces sp. BC1034]|nr:hypothetical protein DFQ30_000344 [Apophysomyces sp. BC1015]KAG0176128.1 hypothetical protein DFQ29_006513 [Apophysomyces sp. BC1021]KAG0186647.1 hypothetical protein DFQ28_007496 [Apophysomyces sp. BC1034]